MVHNLQRADQAHSVVTDATRTAAGAQAARNGETAAQRSFRWADADTTTSTGRTSPGELAGIAVAVVSPGVIVLVVAGVAWALVCPLSSPAEGWLAR